MTRFAAGRSLSLGALIWITCFLALPTARPDPSPPEAMRGKKLLMLFSEGYGANYFLLRDAIDQYGWEITRAGLTDTVLACAAFAAPRGIKPMPVDLPIHDIEDVTDYDAVLLLTATQFTAIDPYQDIMHDAQAMALLARASREGMPIFASCAGVRVLAALDLLQGKEVIGSAKYQDEFETAGATYLGKDRSPVIAGNIVTSARGQYNNVPNGIALSAAMETFCDRAGPKAHHPIDDLQEAEALLDGAEANWIRTYGGPGPDGAQGWCASPGGGSLIVGYTFSHGDGDADLLAVELDDRGHLAWARTFGGAGTEYGYDCAAVEDGYILVGYTTSTGVGSKDVLLLRIDSNGNEIWSRTFGGPQIDIGAAVCVLEDGFALVGTTNSFGAGDHDVFLIRTDLSGVERWRYTFGGELAELGTSVAATGDGGLLIGGATASFGGKNIDHWLIRTDSEGQQLWSRTLQAQGPSGHGFDWQTCMCTTNDGGCILAGHSDCNDLMDMAVIRIDADGQPVWSRAFGGGFYDYANAMHPARDGGILVCGTTKSSDGNNDVSISKLSRDGRLLWTRTVGGPGNDWASGVSETPAGDILVVGHTTSAGAGGSDILLMELPAMP